MKFIDRIIENIPKVGIETYENSDIKYVADSRIILDKLRDYEVEIPKLYFEKYKQMFGNGVLQYMEELTNEEYTNFSGNNTYNCGGRIMHDFSYYSEYNEDRSIFYVAIMVHRFGDIRGSYTEFALFQFDSVENFYEVIDEITYNYCSGSREVNGNTYFYDISIFSEYLRIWCNETELDTEIIACNDEEFDEEIKKAESGR